MFGLTGNTVTLLDRLREVVGDERELEAVLSFAADGGVRYGLAGAIVYLTAKSKGEVFASATYKHGRITSIDPGPSLLSAQAQDALVERARTETAHNHGTVVVSRVLFSQRQLNGVYLWNDVLRLSPCPSTAAIGQGLDWFDHGLPSNFGSGHLGPPFPFLLEVRIQRSPNHFLEGNRKLRQLDAYQYLLTLLLVGHIGLAHWPSGRLWTLLKRGDLPENNLVHPGFSANEDGRNDDFPVRENGQAPVFEGDDYYERLWVHDSELQIPSSLTTDLQLFQSLPRKMASAFVRACYWYALGIQFRSEPSLSTVAFSTAIECLLPRTTSLRCKECDKPLGPGPTQLFNRHIKRYGTVIAALHGRRKLLYDVRSALVHGSHASRVDIDFMSAHRHSEDQLMLLEIVSQRSLINWLRDKERATWHLNKDADHECAG
jgi:hypothetical protein